MCLNHGTLATPGRPWDAVEQAATYTWNYVPYVRVTPAEKREWEAWREGDPIPQWITANPTECDICGREMGAQGMTSHVRYVHGGARYQGVEGERATCPCCHRENQALTRTNTQSRPWCKQCDRGRHIEGCGRPARSEYDAKRRGMEWMA